MEPSFWTARRMALLGALVGAALGLPPGFAYEPTAYALGGWTFYILFGALVGTVVHRVFRLGNVDEKKSALSEPIDYHPKDIDAASRTKTPISRFNWRHGLFRLWVLTSVVWIAGVLVYMLIDARDFTQSRVELYCDPLTLSSNEWRECYRAQQGPFEGDTWFWANLRWNWLILPAGSVLFLLLILAGVGTAKVAIWVKRGFSGPP